MFGYYRYRLYPTRGQEAALRNALSICCELYNAALQERKDAYSKRGILISGYAQMKQLAAVRAARPDVGALTVHLLRDPILRLDRAFRAFFRRCEAGDNPGYPRFKSKDRYRTLTYTLNGKTRWIVSGGRRLSLTGIGDVKIKLHRPYAGTLKQVAVTRCGDGHWYAVLCCADIPRAPFPSTGKSVGIDLGLTHFATLSTGERIKNPRCAEHARRELLAAQRRVSRCRRGSGRRRKSVARFARRHEQVRRARRDFHHKTALDIVRRFDSIAVESLNILALAKSRLSKQVNDAAWAQFISILAYKAESAGRELIKVDPRGTSQECSGCGTVVRKSLAVRVHACLECGLVLDRDHNAALNVNLRSKAGAQPSGMVANG